MRRPALFAFVKARLLAGTRAPENAGAGARIRHHPAVAFKRSGSREPSASACCTAHPGSSRGSSRCTGRRSVTGDVVEGFVNRGYRSLRLGSVRPSAISTVPDDDFALVESPSLDCHTGQNNHLAAGGGVASRYRHQRPRRLLYLVLCGVFAGRSPG